MAIISNIITITIIIILIIDLTNGSKLLQTVKGTRPSGSQGGAEEERHKSSLPEEHYCDYHDHSYYHLHRLRCHHHGHPHHHQISGLPGKYYRYYQDHCHRHELHHRHPHHHQYLEIITEIIKTNNTNTKMIIIIIVINITTNIVISVPPVGFDRFLEFVSSQTQVLVGLNVP